MGGDDTPPKPVEAEQPPPAAEAQPEKTESANGAESTEPNQEDGAEETKNGSAMLKTTAREDKINPQNNRKFDPASREVTDDPAEIRKQVEFYFGDWNFPQDKFMWETCGGSENKPMPIKTIHSFKRMRSFQPYEAVVTALRDSSSLEIAGDEGEETVKRKVAYKPASSNKARFEAASVYVKGFGDETPGTQFDLESFFANFGEVKGLKLRRTDESLFKGSVFVTFADEETANKFINTDPAPKWQGHDLKIMSKHDYCEEKNELIRQGRIRPSASVPRKFYEGKDGKTDRGPRDPNDWKKRREHDQRHGFHRGGGGRGRGRGRGGRGRGGRDNHRGHRDRGGRQENGHSAHNDNDVKPRIQSSTEGANEPVAETNGKRSREDDSTADGAPAAKKVDVKETKAAPAEA